MTKSAPASYPASEITVARSLHPSVEKAPRGQAYLIVLAGARLRQYLVLGTAEVELGRGAGCAMQLDADSVSRKHARIRWTGDVHELSDLGSTNGTYVNERRVTNARLADGDRLQIGHVLIKYIAGSNVEAQYHQEVQRLVRFDGLTGVANRDQFDEALTEAIWRTRAQPAALSVLVLDLDHFKRVNDTYGHTAGDAVLRQTASVIERVVGEAGLFARTGGEEFAVLLRSVDHAGAARLAERIRERVEGTKIVFDGRRIPLTVSIGVAERPATSAEAGEDLYRRADRQLYEAKRAGRNRVR